jgi:hypothetical protein
MIADVNVCVIFSAEDLLRGEREKFGTDVKGCEEARERRSVG